MLFSLLFLLLGLVTLAVGTLLTVRGAIQLSERYGLSEGVVGLSILAVGTDLPEFVVAVSGGVQQLQGASASGLIAGSAIGSAIAQGGLVLGVAGLIGYLPTGRKTLRRDGGALLLAIALVGVLLADGRLSRVEAAAFLIAYGIYLLSLLGTERRRPEDAQVRQQGGLPPPVSLAGGLAIVILGAHLVVSEGIEFAEALGMNQSLVGAVFVAVGTSLPELALSVRAAMERHGSLAVGNVIGSNIFDLLIPMGAAGVISPLTVDAGEIVFDLVCLGIISVVAITLLRRRRGLQRQEAVALVVLYVVYAAARAVLG